MATHVARVRQTAPYSASLPTPPPARPAVAAETPAGAPRPLPLPLPPPAGCDVCRGGPAWGGGWGTARPAPPPWRPDPLPPPAATCGGEPAASGWGGGPPPKRPACCGGSWAGPQRPLERGGCCCGGGCGSCAAGCTRRPRPDAAVAAPSPAPSCPPSVARTPNREPDLGDWRCCSCCCGCSTRRCCWRLSSAKSAKYRRIITCSCCSCRAAAR
jgi:hypothetical protein